jgi:PAS domain S-box-containing protein
MEFVPPHFREVMAEGIRIMMEKKIPSPPLELSFILPNGTEKIFDSRASYITYEGKPAVLAVLRDITERKKLEKALKESQKEFEALAENSIVGTFIVQDGVFKYVNPTLAAMGGYTREEVIGKNPAVFIHPDDVPMVMERMERRLRGEKVTSRYTARAVTKTGEVKVLEFFASRAMVSGKPAIIGIAVDVTETEKAKKALESSEKKFRSLFESAPDVIYILDSEGKVIDVNPSIAKLGYSKEEIVGKYMHEFCTPDCKEKYVTELQKIIETGQARYQVDVFSKNGRVFKFDCSCFAVYSPEKKIQYIIAIHRDVTEKYELSRDLKDAAETLKLLNRMLRHDILNNLNVILLALESVKVSGKDKLLIKHALNSLEKSVRLIDKARELEKMVVSGKELKPLRAIEVIEEVAKRHPEIEINITGDLVVLADEAFESVIDNLVLNSVVHGKATRVDIEMVEEGEYCVIKVKDNGRGIPDEIKERVFQEGFVAGESGHTGLGLYIVKQVIERYGGRVWIEDNFPRGAVIAMRLRRV